MTVMTPFNCPVFVVMQLHYNVNGIMSPGVYTISKLDYWTHL